MTFRSISNLVMNKTKKLLAALFLAIFASGCETYKQQVWTPDSLNYTIQRDREDGAISDYWGLSWNLKP